MAPPQQRRGDALGLAHGATIADPDTDRTSAERVGHDTARVVSARLVPQRYVAMELLHGENLADVAKGRRRVPWRRVLAWARSAAAALDVIHEAGVVHLDLKPANLFLCADGTLKVLDFGIARRSGANASAQRVRHQDAGDAGDETRGGKTMPSHSDEAYAATHVAAATRGHGLVIGTPGYMAPEVLELKKPTAAADAYALAVCVVQLCTGSLPHVAPDEPETWHDPSEVSAWLSAIRAATLRGEMRELGESTLGLPHALAALLTRFLAVAPEARGHTSGSLAALYDEVWARPHGVPDPPYFVQRPYPIEAEGVLFGRDEDTARLGRELVHAPSLVVQGARGAGKSSLIAAGLTPYLAKLGVDGRDDWVFTPVRTQEDLDAALAALEREPAIGRVLALDPLEDMLACPFAHAIEELAERRSSGLRIIGALREETTDAWLASSLGLALRSGLRFVGPPATAAATEIIAGPARAMRACLSRRGGHRGGRSPRAPRHGTASALRRDRARRVVEDARDIGAFDPLRGLAGARPAASLEPPCGTPSA